jgi:hypothetical protein
MKQSLRNNIEEQKIEDKIDEGVDENPEKLL